MKDPQDPPQSGKRSGAPRRSRTNIKDIARLAGVHESTVSRALNPNPDPGKPVAKQTVERVRRIAEHLGYQPNALALGLRRGRSQSIGLVIPDITDAYNGYVVRGIQDEAEARGVAVIIMEDRYGPTERKATVENLINRQVDALIIMTARETDESFLSELAERIPVVLCLQNVPKLDVPQITTDDHLGGRLAAEHLNGLGHARVAQLVCDPTIVCFQQRRDGFTHRAGELGMQVVDFPYVAKAPSFKDGHDLADLLVTTSKQLPTGLFVHTDLMAIGAIGGLAAAGVKCPADISVVSFDASVIGSYFSPTLTTIGVPAYDIGKKTGQVALDAAEGMQNVAGREFSPEIVPGGSTGAPSLV